MFIDCTSRSIDGAVRACQGTRVDQKPAAIGECQAASSTIQVVRARSTRVEQRLEVDGECTSCIIGGRSSAGQEHTGQAKLRRTKSAKAA